MFPTSLKGAALTWFDSLEFESINSFEELVNQFRAQFASSIKIRKVANHLFTIVQGKFESLKAYTQLFNKLKVGILDCNDSTSMEAF